MLDADTPIVLVRTLRAPIAEVYSAWTRPESLKLWLAPGPNVVEAAETDPRVGGRFLLRSRGPDGTRHAVSGVYRALEPDRHILKSWIYDGPLDLLAGEETLLQIDLAPVAADVTEMRLTHRRVARADVREAYRADWPSCFDKLEACLQRSSSHGKPQ